MFSTLTRIVLPAAVLAFLFVTLAPAPAHAQMTAAGAYANVSTDAFTLHGFYADFDRMVYGPVAVAVVGSRATRDFGLPGIASLSTSRTVFGAGPRVRYAVPDLLMEAFGHAVIVVAKGSGTGRIRGLGSLSLTDWEPKARFGGGADLALSENTAMRFQIDYDSWLNLIVGAAFRF